jgi:hypothetical protein
MRYQSFIPVLYNGATTGTNAEDKAKILAKSFFLEPPEANLSDITEFNNYPTPLPAEPITESEIV